MKFRRTSVILLIVTMIVMTLTGCGEAVNNDNTDTNFVNISNSRLSYDTTTGIVYHYNSVYLGTVYTVYYSENGKMCKYVDGHIVEIETDDTDVDNSENNVVITNEKEKDKEYNTTVDKSEDYVNDSEKDMESPSSIYWNTDFKSIFAENYVKAHANDIDNAYSVRVYYDIDEKYHACGSMIFGKSDTYSEHEFDDTGRCKYCGYVREESRNN